MWSHKGPAVVSYRGGDSQGSSSEIALEGSWFKPNLVLSLSLLVSLRSTLGIFVEPLLFLLPLDLLLTKLHVDLDRGRDCDCAGMADIFGSSWPLRDARTEQLWIRQKNADSGTVEDSEGIPGIFARGP